MESRIPVRIYSMFYVFLAAVSVGWLMGLSVSPVLHILVASLVAAVVAVVSALSGIRPPAEYNGIGGKQEGLSIARVNHIQVSPVPVAILAFGLAVGASAGTVARTNEIFAPNKAMFVRRWQGTGMSDIEVKRRLFDQLYPPLPPKEKDVSSPEQAKSQARESPEKPRDNAGRSNALTAALFAASAEECQLLAAKHGSDLRARLLLLEGDRLEKPLQACHSDDCLEGIKELLCPQ